MKVLVCGSRKVSDPDATRNAIAARLGSLPKDVTILHGGANGVDMWADAIAWAMGLPATVMPADWETHGRSAGILRNNDMLDLEPDLVLAFWDGSSRGTKHTIDEARRRGIPVEVELLA